MITIESFVLLSLQTYNMATSTIGDMPFTHPEVEKYFTQLAFYIEAKDLNHISKAVLLSSCGAQAFSLTETLLAPIAITDETVAFNAIQTAVLAHLHPKKSFISNGTYCIP